MPTPEIRFTQLFINNEYVNSVSGKTFPTVNPTTEKEICQVQEGAQADIDIAVKAARDAFHRKAPWRTIDASQRGLYLLKMADLIEKDKDYIANLETLDNGKVITDSLGDIGLAIRVLRYYAGWADKITGNVIPADGNVMSYTRREPVGVVGGIVPWNYPFHLAILKLAPALCAGCTLVLKPAEQTPLTCLLIGDYARQAGIPKGVVNIVPGYGPTAGAALTNHQDVNKLSFTGSTEVGRLILQGSGTTNLKRVTLELGGKSPLIVCDDIGEAELTKAAELSHRAAMANAGQCCVAATRTFVQAGVYDAFVQKVKESVAKRVVGDPFDAKVEQGPQIDQTQLDKILELIESGKKEGATVVTGGKRMDREGFYVEPTVFANVTDQMRIAKEEIFGPVQNIFKFENLDEAIDRANTTSYGLGAGVITNRVDRAINISAALEAGSVFVNCFLQVSQQTPFGGFKQSGHGRELGEYGLDGYLENKTVTISLPFKQS